MELTIIVDDKYQPVVTRAQEKYGAAALTTVVEAWLADRAQHFWQEDAEAEYEKVKPRPSRSREAVP